MKKHRLLQAVLVAFILIAAYGAYRYMVVTKPVAEKNKAKKSVVHVRADTVALRDYDVVYTCFAKVHAGATVRLSSEVSARIVAGPVALREGTSFRKGDLLVRLYDDDARASLMAARSRYMSLLSQQLSDLAVDFPQEADKWNAFFNGLSVDEDLPPLPAINSAKEKVYLAVRNVISEFRNFIDHIVDFFESLCLLFTRFHSHESFQKSFCSGSIHISACFLHCLHDHLCHITGGLRIQSFIIVPCKSFLKFFHRYFLILIDQFADCKKSICHIGDSKSLRTCKVVNSSTFLDRLAFFQTVIYHTGKEW